MATWIYFQDTGLGVNLDTVKTLFLSPDKDKIQIEFPGDEQCMEISKSEASDPAIFNALYTALRRYVEKSTLDVNIPESGE